MRLVLTVEEGSLRNTGRLLFAENRSQLVDLIHTGLPLREAPLLPAPEETLKHTRAARRHRTIIISQTLQQAVKAGLPNVPPMREKASASDVSTQIRQVPLKLQTPSFPQGTEVVNKLTSFKACAQTFLKLQAPAFQVWGPPP